MRHPVVYLSSQSFLSILFAAVDTGKRECLGIMFGREDNRSGSKLIIQHVCAIQSVSRRTPCSTEQSQASHLRIQKMIACAPRAFNFIGYFHSHPQWSAKEKHYPMPSKSDLQSCLDVESKVEIIVDIGRTKDGYPWLVREGGAVVGRVANWRFVLHAYRAYRDGDRIVSEQLKLRVDPHVFLTLRHPKVPTVH